MATTYSIQTVELPVGTVEVKLVSPTAGLTVPTYPSLILSGEFSERLDVLPGEVEFESVEFEYIEDYTTYGEGFWYKVLTDTYAHIRVIVEGSCIFFGRVMPQDINNTEKSLITDSIYRTGSFTCLSMLSLLRETAIEDVEVMLRSQCITATTIDGSVETLTTFLPVKTVFGAAMSCALGVAYADSYVVHGCDIQFGDASDNWYSIEDLNFRGYQGGVWYNGFSAAGGWMERYPDALSFIVAIARCFGLVVRYYYNEGGSSHYLDLRTRGTAYASSYSAGTPFESNQILSAASELSQVEVAYQIARSGTPTVKRHFYTGYPDVGTLTVEPPLWQPEIVLVPELRDTVIASQDPDELTLYYHHVEDTPEVIDDMVTMQYARYWDYGTAAWSSANAMEVVIAMYFVTRFSGRKRVYERLYPAVYTDLAILQNHLIDDDVLERDFYSTEVRKNLQQNTTWVRWQEV